MASRLQPIGHRGDPCQANSIALIEPKLAELASDFAGCPVKVRGSDELAFEGEQWNSRLPKKPHRPMMPGKGT